MAWRRFIDRIGICRFFVVSEIRLGNATARSHRHLPRCIGACIASGCLARATLDAVGRDIGVARASVLCQFVSAPAGRGASDNGVIERSALDNCMVIGN